MIGQAYLRDQPPPPARWQRYLDQCVLPVAIDAAGSAEAVLEHVAQAARRQPVMALGLAGVVAFLAGAVRARRVSREGSKGVSEQASK
jgi:hypothetical protein